MSHSKRNKFAKIPQKSVFRDPAAMPKFQTVGLKEQTGNASELPNQGMWPIREETSIPSEIESRSEGTSILQKTGRTWPDILYELLIQDRFITIFLMAFATLIIVLVWQDNAAGRIETLPGILLTLRKIAIYGALIGVFCLITKFTIRKK